MMLEALEEAFELLEQVAGDFEGKKTPELVAKGEKVLGLEFPPSYREFLLRYGCGDVEGIELFGILHDDFENSAIPDAVWFTLSERKSGLPWNYVIVAETGDGGYYVLDTSQKGGDGECPVLLYGVDGDSEQIAPNYGSFLLAELKTVI